MNRKLSSAVLSASAIMAMAGMAFGRRGNGFGSAAPKTDLEFGEPKSSERLSRAIEKRKRRAERNKERLKP